jgi:hypothetical protein
VQSLRTFYINPYHALTEQFAIDWLLEVDLTQRDYSIARRNPHATSIFTDVQLSISNRLMMTVLNYLQFITTTQYLRSILIKELVAERDETIKDFFKNNYSQYDVAQKTTIKKYFECAQTYYEAFNAFISLNLIFDKQSGISLKDSQPIINLRKEYFILRNWVLAAKKLEVASIDELGRIISTIQTFLTKVETTPNSDIHHVSNLREINAIKEKNSFDNEKYKANYLFLLASLSRNSRLNPETELNSIEIYTRPHVIVLKTIINKIIYELEYLRQFNDVFEQEDFDWNVAQSSLIDLNDIASLALPAFVIIANLLFPHPEINIAEVEEKSDVQIKSSGVNVLNKLREILQAKNVTNQAEVGKLVSNDLFAIPNPKRLKPNLSLFLHGIANNIDNFSTEAASLNTYNAHYDFEASKFLIKDYWKELTVNFISSDVLNKFESNGLIISLLKKIAHQSNEHFTKINVIQVAQPAQNNGAIVGTQAQLQYLQVPESYVSQIEANGIEAIAEAEIVRDFTANLLNTYYSGSLPKDQKKLLGIKIAKALEICGDNAPAFNNTQLHDLMIVGDRNANWAILHAELKRLKTTTHLEKLMASALYDYVSCTDELLNSQSLSIWQNIRKRFMDLDIKFERSKVISDLIKLIKDNSVKGSFDDENLFKELKRIMSETWLSDDSSNSKLFIKLKEIKKNKNMIFMFTPIQEQYVSKTEARFAQLDQRDAERKEEHARDRDAWRTEAAELRSLFNARM